MKRVFDVALAVLGLLICWPVLAAIALLIFLTGGRPVFFRQERVGQGGRMFRIWKFRTMVQNAEQRGGQLTVGEDSRITSVGQILRKLKLDELPQLFNVLGGDMSFVGPRPEVPRYVRLYSAEQRRVLDLVPGITDVASIHYCDESEILAGAEDPEREYVRRIMRGKIHLNLRYARRAHVVADMVVIARTVLRVFSYQRLHASKKKAA